MTNIDWCIDATPLADSHAHVCPQCQAERPDCQSMWCRSLRYLACWPCRERSAGDERRMQ
jgi:hypothetical protein